MLILPKTVGPITLVRKLGTGGVAESYEGTLQGSQLRSVIVRRVLPYMLQDPGRIEQLDQRVRDLLGLGHPNLVRLVEWVVDGDERFIVEEKVQGIDLARLLQWCRANQAQLPPNVFLNLATQICKGLEALHATRGRGSGSASVLHLGLKPGSIFVNHEGEVLIGGYGLCPSPTLLPQGGPGGSPVPFRMEYLSPEQTRGERELGPQSDLFSLGAILYEILTLEPIFRAETSLQTIGRIRRGEITNQLLKIRDVMPGLDKVLYRALSLSPRHRYQRAFVMREDLRALMSNYSFSSISTDIQSYLAPLFSGSGTAVTGLGEEPTGSLLALTDVPETPDHTMARIADAQEQSLPADPSAGLVDLAPNATGHQDDFEEEIATRLKLGPDSQSLGPLSSWDSEPLTSETTNETSTELTQEISAPLPVSDPETGRAGLIANSASVPETSSQLESPPQGRMTQNRLQHTGQSGLHMGPRTVDQLGSPSRLAEDPQHQRREANTALRNIRAAARSTPPEANDSAVYEWKNRHGSRVTGAAILAGIGVVCASAGIVFLGLGYLGLNDTPERGTAESPSEVPSRSSAQEANKSSQDNVEQSHSNDRIEETQELSDPGPVEAPNPEVRAMVEPSLPPRSVEAPQSDPSPSRSSTEATSASSSPGSSSSASRATGGASQTASARRAVRVGEDRYPNSYEISQDAILSSALDSPEEFEGETLIDLDWDYYARRAEQGTLSPSDQILLEGVPSTDEDAFTRSRALLLMHAQRSDDSRATQLYLQQLFLIPSNQYNPVYLTAQAQVQVNQHRFEAALLSASKAERYWQNIPSALITEKLAEIYEVKARSNQGLFYQSEDLDDLDEALMAWSSYRDHVAKHSRRDLMAVADRELDKLRDTRARME